MRFTLLLIGCLIGTLAAAQCEPDFDFGEALWGASPDASAGEQFDTAYVGVPYADVFHVLVPTDASAIDPMFTLPLDSVILVNVTLVDTTTLETSSLADIGLEIVCNNLGSSPNPCTLISGAQYCASLEGTPTTGGVFQMSLEVQAWVTVFGVGVPQPYSFNGYILDVVGESSNDIAGGEHHASWEAFPNPVNNQLVLKGLSPAANVAIFNIAGQSMPLHASVAQGHTRSIDTSSWNAGLYFVAVTSATGVNTQKILVQH